MTHQKTPLAFLTVSALAALLLTACSEPSPAENLRGAKQSLASGDRRAAVIQLKAALQADPKLQEARFLLGKSLLDAGEPKTAIIEFRKAQAGGMAEDELLPVLASAMLLAGEVDRVIAEFGDSELKQRKAHAELKAVVATARGLKNQIEAARADAEEALRFDPDNLAAALVLVRATAETTGPKAALAAVDAVTAKHPKAASAWLLRAELFAANREDAAAQLAAHAQVLKVDPRNISALAASVALHGHRQEFDAAERFMATLEKEHPRHPLTVFQKTLLQLQRGQLDKAAESAQTLVRLTPRHARALHLAGVVAFQRGAYLQASANLAKAIGEGEVKPDVRILLARTHLRLGDSSKALTVLRPLLERKLPIAALYATAGEAYLQQGEMAPAQAMFDRAVKLDPNDKTAQTALVMAKAPFSPPEATDAALQQIGASDTGVVSEMALIAHRLQRRQLPEAMLAIDELARKQPDRPLPHMLRGRVELVRGNAAKAKEHFLAAQKADPNHFPAVAALARYDLADGKRESAEQRYKQLIESKSGDLNAEMALISLRSAGGASTAELVELIQQTVKRHPGDPEPQLALTQTLLDAGQFKEGLVAAQQAVARFPAVQALQESLARGLQLSGDFNQALVVANKMVSAQPNAPEPLLRVAEIQLAKGDRAGCVANLRKALSVREDYLPAQLALATLMVEEGKLDQARQIAQQVQRQRPRDAAGWLLAGDIERQAKAYAAAVVAYREAQRRADDAKVQLRLHGSLMQSGQVQEARAGEAAWLAKHPNDVVFRTYLGERAAFNQDFAQAQKWFGEVVALQPRNAVVLNNLAWVQHLGGSPEAQATIEKALKLRPDAPAGLDTLASILAAKGRFDEAIKHQRRAVDLDGGQPVHRLHLAEYLLKAGRRDDARREVEQLAKLGPTSPLAAEVKALQAQL